MSTKTIIAVILIALGIVVLSYSGITYTTRGKSVDILGIHIETAKRHFIPPFAGVISLTGGLVLLVVYPKKD